MNQGEVEKLWKFDGFRLMIMDEKRLLKPNPNLNKYLTQKRDTDFTKTKKGILEIVSDKVDPKNNHSYDTIKEYTTYEIYLDMFIFMCSTGARWTDMINMKLRNFKHERRTEQGLGDEGIVGFFEFQQIKTNTIAIPRANEISFDIYRKYSWGKHSEDFLFPRGLGGIPTANQVFNRMIKKICKIIGLNRKISYREYGRKGNIVEKNSGDVKLHELVSSHVGRKTSINIMVNDKSLLKHKS